MSAIRLRKFGRAIASLSEDRTTWDRWAALLGEELDERADLYSAGVVLYECLTGKLPFEASTPIALIAKVLEETPAPPHTLYDDIPAPISLLVMRTMARERDARPASAEKLHEALEQLG